MTTLPAPNMDYEIIATNSRLNKDDIIIAVMGPTGSGKSKIIDTLLGCQVEERSGSGLESCTSEVSAFRIKNHRTLGNRVVLVDTPGFDDTHKSDLEILETIANWLVNTYGQNVNLTGILYLQRITDNRVGGTPHRNLRMFGTICGDKAARSVVLVTTMWDKLRTQESQKMGRQRETELKSLFWGEMIKNHASVSRFDNTPESAWRIVDDIIARHAEGAVLLLQEEVVDFHRTLKETKAGQEALGTLHGHLSKQREKAKDLMEMTKTATDPKIAARLNEDIRTIQIQLDKTSEEIERLQISFTRKMMLFFSKKPKARVIKA